VKGDFGTALGLQSGYRPFFSPPSIPPSPPGELSPSCSSQFRFKGVELDKSWGRD
jgi:hypothetical protein